MATVSYYLAKAKPDKKGRVQIMLQCTHNGKRFRYYTGEKIDPKFWSNSKKNPIKPAYNDDGTLINYLNGLETKILNIVRDYKGTQRTLSIDMLKTKFLQESSNETGRSFLELFDHFINSSSINRAKGTTKNYKNSLHYLTEFQKDKNFDYQFEAINMAFYEAFTEYLIVKKELSNNTVGRIVKVLKTFLNWSIDNKFNNNLEYKKFKVAREEIEIIYLTDIELKNLFNLKITDEVVAKAREEFKDLTITKEPLDRARDLFCFGCFTGLRFSDIASMDKNNIKDDEIQVRTQKTKDMLSIPLIPQAASILKKYNNSLPVISNQKLNKALKALGKVAEIKQEIAIQRYRGAKRLDSKIPKHKLITTHTARRTFITLSLEKGIRPEVVMSITGHKDYRTFKAYIKITDTIKRESLLNAWK
jgi:integrase